MVCVYFKGRQGPPRPARRRTSGENTLFLFSRHTHTHTRAARRAKSRNEVQTNHKHTQRAAHSTLRSRVRRVPAHASAPPRRRAKEQRGASERRGEKDREHARTANRDKGKRTFRSAPARRVRHTACVARPLVVRAPRPPAVSGSGAKGAGARTEQGEAQDGRFPRTRTASSEGARRSDSLRAARVGP